MRRNSPASSRMPRKALGLGDTFVLHTVTASQLLGLSIWLKSIPIRDMHIKVVLRADRLEGPRAKLNVAFYKYVFDVLEKNARDRVAIFADSDALTESFQKRYAVPDASSPLPIEYFHEPIKTQSAKGNCITFVYAGESLRRVSFARRSVRKDRDHVSGCVISNTSDGFRCL